MFPYFPCYWHSINGANRWHNTKDRMHKLRVYMWSVSWHFLSSLLPLPLCLEWLIEILFLCWSDVFCSESASSPLLHKARYCWSMCHLTVISLCIKRGITSHLYGSAGTFGCSLGHLRSFSLSAQRESFSKYCQKQTNHIWHSHCNGHMCLKCRTVLFPHLSCRVCKCSGAGDGPEVHHWPGSNNATLDRTL